MEVEETDAAGDAPRNEPVANGGSGSKPPCCRPKVILRSCLYGLVAAVAIVLFEPWIRIPCGNRSGSQAENTALQLKNAIASYSTEYRRYPVDPDLDPDTVFRTDSSFMEALLGSETERGLALNPRRIVFYTNRAARDLGNGKFANGLTMNPDGSGELWDPYGNHYYIRLDLSGENRVRRPDWDAGGEPYVPESILVWSAGKSGREDRGRDNIKTW